VTTYHIVAIYVALNLALATILLYRVSQVRQGKKINLGDGGDEVMFSRIRAHGNFTENAPLALLGLFGLAILEANPIAIHVFGAAFFIGRIFHAMGMAKTFSQGRFAGTLLTLLTYFGTAGYLLFLAFTG